MAIFVPRFVRQLRDVLLTAPADGEVLTYDSADEKWKNAAGGGGGGAPTTADYLVGTAQAGLSAEIVVGATPAGELGGTWGSPTVDTVHSGSSHAQAQAAAEATAAGALTAHDADTTNVHGIADTSLLASGAEVAAALGLAVILAPATTARNVILPTAADVQNLTLAPFAAQTAALQVWRDAAGKPTAWLGADDSPLYADLNTHFLLSRAGSDGFFDPNAGAAFTPGATEGSAGFWGDFEVLPTADNNQFHYGFIGDNRLGVTTRPVTAIFGFLYDAWQLGTKASGTGAQIDTLVGGSTGAFTLSASTGDVTEVVGFIADGGHSGTGLVSTLTGLRAKARIGDPGAGVVSNAYGLHVSEIGHATKVVNAYGLWIAAPLGSGETQAIHSEGGVWFVGNSTAPGSNPGGGGYLYVEAGVLKFRQSDGVIFNTTDHSARHESGGADAIKLDDLAAPDDNTDLNASTTAHGLLRKLSNIATEYLDGTGAWSTPAGGGGGGAPTTATYITQTADAGLSAEQALSALATGLVKNTTGTGVLSIGAAGTDYYAPGGTDVALADGGTGASLTDPNADRLMFWDDSAGATAYLTPGTNLTITGTTIDAAGGAAYPARARAVISGVTQYSIPGWTQTISPSTWTASANRAQYFPIFVEDEMVIDRIVVELTTGVAISTMRLCIYNADTSWQPTSLVTNTDTGDLLATVASVGVIATTITDTTLAPGRYLAWLATSTGNHVFRSIRGSGSIYLGYPVALGANSVFSQIWIAQTYAAPPSTGLAWTTGNVGSTHFDHPVFVRIKTP